MKSIVIGVTGGIAAYKTCYLVSSLKKRGYDVHVVMTVAATKFVSPLTFQSLSHNPVEVEMFSPPRQWDVKHISLARRADLLAVAPCTANFLGKVANGIADDLLSTVVMATKAPVLLVPAMNCNMYDNPLVQANMDRLRDYGYHLMDAESGYLACGDEGKGRMPEPDRILQEIEYLLTSKTLAGKKILITAGPTREYWDSVRFMSNPSTGKMGYALAYEAVRRGGDVFLITGPTHLEAPARVQLFKVETTEEMYSKIISIYPEMNVVIKAAAPSDYRPKQRISGKLKKRNFDSNNLNLELERNPDILKELGEKRGEQILVGFAAETEHLIEYGKQKLKEKHLDLLVANQVGIEFSGFASNTNKAYFITDNAVEELPVLSKEELASRILDWVENKMRY